MLKMESDDDYEKEILRIKSNPELLKKEKIKIWKNLIIICLAFLCNFTAFNGASVLQSSLNDEDGLGVGSLAIIYGSLIISALFAPSFVIKKLGCKWTIVIAICGYVTYSLANFYPAWSTLVPSSIIVGLSGAPLWSAKSAYLTTSAARYAKLVDENKDAQINVFFGIFFLFFQFTFIVGNLISSFVLSAEASKNLEFPKCYNATYIDNFCGVNDCPDVDFNVYRSNYTTTCEQEIISSDSVEKSTLYTLMGVYAGVGLLGSAITAIFVDNIQLRKKETRSPFELVIATITHIKDKKQLLLIPITMYSGFEQAWITGDYTKSYITCPLGVNWVGFILICYGACDSVCSLLFGKLEKYTGRTLLFTFASVINASLLIVFYVVKPYPDSQWLFFLLVALWGVSDAVWQTQLNALYGFVFLSNQEAAFANYRLWESLGFVISFAYQGALCVLPKIWITFSMLIVGMTCYCVLEVKVLRKINLMESVKEGKDNTAYYDERETNSTKL